VLGDRDADRRRVEEVDNVFRCLHNCINMLFEGRRFDHAATAISWDPIAKL